MTKENNNNSKKENSPRFANIWFTSDCHYFHSNIIKYCNRPFKDVFEMNDHLIEQHNKVVKPNDIVYNLGDFTFQNTSKAVSVLNQLNGIHRFIRGNHDTWLEDDDRKGTMALREAQDEFLRQGGNKNKIEWIKDYHEFRHDGNLFCLMHFPLLTWHHAYKGNSINLFGHVHGMLNGKTKGKQLDVGVDSAYKILGTYRPFNINEIMHIMNNVPVDCPEMNTINDNPWDKTKSNLE